MDPRQSYAGEGSQGQFPGGDGSQGQFHGPNNGAYHQPSWNQYIYVYQAPVYQPPAGWPSQGFQPRGPNVEMMNPSGHGQDGFHQPQPTEANMQHSEAELNEEVAPAGKTRGKKSSSRTKLCNFNPDEDKNLVRSWLEISCDPITSTGQKKDNMWQRIMDRYNIRRGSNPERSLRSLQSHWNIIRTEVTVFASYHADAVRENPSGISDADKTTLAVSNYAAALQNKFGFLHCWELMKDVPKWQDPSAIAARGEGFGEDCTAATETGQPGEGQSSPVRSGPQTRRPMGRDSAKAAKKKANSDAGSSSSAEYAAKLQDLHLQRNTMIQEESVRRGERFQQLASIDERRFEEMTRNNEALIRIEQAKLQFMREKHEVEQRRIDEDKLKEEKKEDERILSIDLDACPPNARKYYEICQQEKLEKQAARHRRSEGP